MSLAMTAAAPRQNGSDAPNDPAVTVTPSGRLRQDLVADTERNMAIAIHLTPLVGAMAVGPLAILAPLILWLVKKDESIFVDDHGRETMNFLISLFLIHLILGITVIGVVLFPVVWIVFIVNAIRGAVSASNSEYFRYPLTIRFLQ